MKHQNQSFDERQSDQGGNATLVRDGRFLSDGLGREVRYRVLLPADYDSSSYRYPVLYLLHGLYGDCENWTTRTHLNRYAAGLNLIIAMPDAGNSWYADSRHASAANAGGSMFETYIAKDFIQEIDGHYRTLLERHTRAIGGLSMGGYGAVKLALKYPELFVMAGGISSAFDAPRDLHEKNPEFREELLQAFGPPHDPTRKQNDVFELAAQAKGKQLPYFYLDCGTGDSFIQSNREFAQRLLGLGIPYEYHEVPGAHAWDYWDSAIARFLQALKQKMAV
ncbi:MAG TPA: alpha/beta hydrolase family protein [Candidatus Angelobacter sp.]|nr:alpha/beta hydrolase family protein [Candidatus Angelobacter sp.]